VEKVGHRVDGRLHEGDCPSHQEASAQEVSDGEGHREVHETEGDGLGHGKIPLAMYLPSKIATKHKKLKSNVSLSIIGIADFCCPSDGWA
jgi:hypothetical protein